MITSRSLYKTPTPPQEVDAYALQAFHDDVHAEFRNVQSSFDRHNATISYMQDRLNRLDTMLTWIETHRPEAIIDFKTTQNVAMRLADSHNDEADMVKEMQVTP